MNDTSTGTRAVIVERELPYPPEKIWRALTEPHLIAEWLAKTDFNAVTGHRFTVKIDPQPDRSFVFACEVTAVEPHKVLTYTWNSVGDESGNGLRSTVTWRLTATPTGTLLRMEQSGFAPDRPHFYHGARMGWPQFVTKLEEVLARID
ncbi:SRPBCC domain-containing protein [Nordella sp. HKS 07]|uniref:SRPBCC family protein n=1 Tax=Nordella sp. HKS 07 TaxID=2712222 RepID=UPI0013E198C2|nr:SRPBCC domain-containing protein [Nordella sp. HKS 07]QIG48312.1 SRPBCC domain-containing protein [Nordella sp. HKS 07]